MQTSDVSNSSGALQALQMLMASLRTGGAGAVGGAGSAGQGLPGGALSTATASAAPTLMGSSPGGQFVSSALAFLTSLQDPDSAGVAAAKATADVAIDHVSSDLNSALDQLTQALNGSSSTASTATTPLSGAAGTSSNGAASLATGTSSSLFQVLDQLTSALGLTGAHHHHHHGGGGSVQTASASTDPLAISTGSAAPVSLT
jgi:hypothetical protein